MDFSDIKVLVIGDICLNILSSGESNRLAPEAPVPVIKNIEREYSLGMAGNVALNLKNLGADVTIETLVGPNDTASFEINSLLDNEGINNPVREIYNNGNLFPTIVKERIMANNQQVARLDIEKFPTDHKEMGRQLASLIDDCYKINEFDFVIISDYNKGVITKENWEFYYPVLEKINKSGLFFVDTKKTDILPLYKGMIITPNEKEVEAILEYNNLYSITNLLDEMDSDFIINTASKRGAFSYSKNEIIHEPTQVQDVIDVYGAGDTFIAAFSLYYYKFKNIRMALRFANYCCSYVVSKLGCVSVNINEVIDFERRYE